MFSLIELKNSTAILYLIRAAKEMPPSSLQKSFDLIACRSGMDMNTLKNQFHPYRFYALTYALPSVVGCENASLSFHDFFPVEKIHAKSFQSSQLIIQPMFHTYGMAKIL